MKIFEILTMSRSGSHAIINWMTKNVLGAQMDFTYKLSYYGDGKFIYINEANYDTGQTFRYLDDHGKRAKHIFMCYEETFSNYTLLSDDNLYKNSYSLTYPSISHFSENRRIILIRDFFNLAASRQNANENTVFKDRNGNPFLFNLGENFINKWKDHARLVVEKKCNSIKYEDWMKSKEVRVEFLKNVFLTDEIEGIDVIGTDSSFGENKKYDERYKQVNFSDEFKNLIKNDNELYYLLGALGYEYKQF